MNKAKNQSKKDGKKFLKGRFIDVEKAFVEELKRAQGDATHSGTLGDAWEKAWIELLQKYLPTRYRVAKAFAVDHLGHTTDQLDCLIYDAYFTPALFGKDNYLYVPAEAVYATFEVKPSVTLDDLVYAAGKVASLRALKRTSAPLGVNKARTPFPIIGGLLALNTSWKGGFGKPFLKEFNKLSGNKKLDLILTAESGFCDALGNGRSPVIFNGPGALVRGLFRLLRAIRDKASVVAVEWDKYESVFDSN